MKWESPQDLGGYWRFLKILSKGGLGPIAILGGNGLFRGDKFFQGGLRAYCIFNGRLTKKWGGGGG